MAQPRMTSATYAPNGYGNEYNMPHRSPELVSPEPRRFNPDMSNQIADGIQNMDISNGVRSMSQTYSGVSGANEVPHLSPFPKLVNPPPNVPPSDDALEERLESARIPVLNSNDPEMQLAWAQDALMYTGVCAEDAERMATLKLHAPRPATPRIEHQIKEDAMNIVTFLADQHHPKAEFLRGMWLEWGRFGQREDKKEAFRCYSRAADKGYARAEYRIGMLYESYNDPVKALRHYNRGVDAGDAASCYRLGMMTLRGQHGQTQDFTRAVDLIRRSAEGADENAPQGAYVYGMLLARQLPQIDLPDGHLPYDERLAKQNIEKAAYMKFAKAQSKMGSCYELGMLGCDFHPALSVHYNALASKQGEAEADMALSKWFLVGSEGLFPKNEQLAYTYAERAVQGNLPTAEFALGYFNEIGMYVPVNLDKALEWYHKAAQHGNEDAKNRIEGLSKNKVLSRKDHENVAVNRIKSQHGSMKGVRPDRFRSKQTPQLGQVPESPSMPTSQFPPRASSTVPYPIGDRPASVTPYPLNDSPAMQSLSPPRMSAGPVGGFYSGQPPRPATTINAEMRPNSAFQINPDLRPESTMSQIPPNRRPYPPAPGSAPYTSSSRPNSTQTYDSRPLPPQVGGRVMSGPTNMPRLPPRTGPAPAMPGQQYLQHSPSVPSKPDFGYNAPVDDARSRYNANSSSMPRLNHADSMPNFNTSMPPPSSAPAGGRMSNASSSTAPRPAPDNRRPYNAGGNNSSGAPPKLPQKDSAVAKPTGPSKTASNGPKTFEEMGVPAHKQNEECVIM